MAGRAVPITRVCHIVRRGLRRDSVALAAKAARAIVAFQTNCKDYRALQQPGVHRAVWRVTNLAAIDPGRCMLKEKRPALVDVAFQTRLLILKASVNHLGPPGHLPSWRVGPVGVVAVRTVHEALINPMLEGLGELSPYFVVATITDLALSFREQVFGRLRLMYRVTRGTRDVGLRMRASPDVGSVSILGMTAEARIEGLPGVQFGKGDDRRFPSLCVDVFATWTMTPLTPAGPWIVAC